MVRKRSGVEMRTLSIMSSHLLQFRHLLQSSHLLQFSHLLLSSHLLQSSHLLLVLLMPLMMSWFHMTLTLGFNWWAMEYTLYQERDGPIYITPALHDCTLCGRRTASTWCSHLISAGLKEGVYFPKTREYKKSLSKLDEKTKRI